MTELRCAVCLFVRTGLAAEAVTVLNGFAVCDDHLHYVPMGELNRAIRIAREESS